MKDDELIIKCKHDLLINIRHIVNQSYNNDASSKHVKDLSKAYLNLVKAERIDIDYN